MWRLSKTNWWERLKLRIKSMVSPSAQTVLDMDAKLKSFGTDLTERADAINERIKDINQHLDHFRRVQDLNNASIDKIMAQFEQDIPAFQDQVPWESGIFDLPYGEDNRLYFNPTVVDIEGTCWLIIRNCQIDPHKAPPYNSFSKLTRYALDGTKVLYSTKRDIPLPLGRTKLEQWEDPRILYTGRRLWLTCTNFIQHKTYAHQTMAVLDATWNVIGINHPVYGKNGHDIWANKGHEKNWTWFMHEGEPHLIYNIEPHTVVRCDAAASPVSTYETRIDRDIWYYGQRRGGSNPVRIGNEYFAFFHSSTPWWNGRRRYYMGAYAFEAKPPFRITRCTTMPLMYGSKNNRRVLEFPLVIFPGGSLFDKEKQEHFVVFGVNDFESGWVKIPHEDLLDLMRVYVQVDNKDIEGKDENTVTAKTGDRLPSIAPVEKVTGDGHSDQEVVWNYGDEGYPGAPEKRVSKTTHRPPAKRKRSRAVKARKS
jgi:predicted GH43/DUF377 family glycosyl hydrolase